MAEPSARDDSRIWQLDGVRGVAITLVLVWHDVAGLVRTTPGSIGAYALRALSFTWAGVDLFFVLSGFLIGGLLIQHRDSPRYFPTFYVRRMCRIFPLYYAMLALFLLCAALLPGRTTGWHAWLFDNASPGWAYAGFVQNFTMVRSGLGANWIAVTWSLAVEEQFYLIAPLLVWFVPVARLPGVLGLLILMTPLVRTIIHFWLAPSDIGSYLLLPARWDALCIGMFAAWVWHQRDGVNRFRRAVPAARAGLLAGLFVLGGLIATRQNIGSLGMAVAGYTVTALCSGALIVLAMATPGGLTQRLLRWRPLVWLGTVSYGVYLFHRPMTGAMHGLLLGHAPRIEDGRDAAVTLLALGCTLLAAQLSAHFFERPIIRLGRRHARY